MKNRNEKQFVLSILLVVVILGIGTTIALSTAISKPVVNSFQAADHETNIKEEIDGLKKTIQVKNTADKSAAFVRVRIVISPAKALGQDDYMIQGQNWTENAEQDGFYYYTKTLLPGEETEDLIFEVKNKEEVTESFDVLVYEESCVATSTSDSLTIEQIKEAFKKADGTTDQNQG